MILLHYWKLASLPGAQQKALFGGSHESSHNTARNQRRLFSPPDLRGARSRFRAKQGADQDRLRHGADRRLAADGKAALLGCKIWEEEINAKGGLLGRPVKLIYYDDQSNPSTVPGIFTKLLDVDKVDLVIGDYGTNLMAPAMPVVIQHK